MVDKQSWEVAFEDFARNLHWLAAQRWYAHHPLPRPPQLRPPQSRPGQPRFGGGGPHHKPEEADLEAIRQGAMGYALRLTSRNHDLAQDLVQEALIRYWHRRENLGEPAHIQAYLGGIIHNLYISHYRSQQRFVDDCAHIEEVQAPDNPMQEVLERLDFEACLDALADLYQKDPASAQLIFQHNYGGIQLQQLAQWRDENPGVTRKKHHRLLQRLRDRLNNQ